MRKAVREANLKARAALASRVICTYCGRLVEKEHVPTCVHRPRPERPPELYVWDKVLLDDGPDNERSTSNSR